MYLNFLTEGNFICILESDADLAPSEFRERLFLITGDGIFGYGEVPFEKRELFHGVNA